MCGIVGAVSTRNIVPILVQGLQRLADRLPHAQHRIAGLALHLRHRSVGRDEADPDHACAAAAARIASTACISSASRV